MFFRWPPSANRQKCTTPPVAARTVFTSGDIDGLVENASPSWRNRSVPGGGPRLWAGRRRWQRPPARRQRPATEISPAPRPHRQLTGCGEEALPPGTTELRSRTTTVSKTCHGPHSCGAGRVAALTSTPIRHSLVGTAQLGIIVGPGPWLVAWALAKDRRVSESQVEPRLACACPRRRNPSRPLCGRDRSHSDRLGLDCLVR